MMLNMMKSKIHHAKVTETLIEYEGSVTIDENIMEKAGMLVNEKVQVLNLNNGERFETYTIKGKRGSKTICLNGPAARLAIKGDRIIIISYPIMSEEEAKKFQPTVVVLDEKNNIKQIKK